MDKYQVIERWAQSTEDTIKALREWLDSLRNWQAQGGEEKPGDFDAAWEQLTRVGLFIWAWDNPADIEALADAVKGPSGDCEEPEL